MLCKFQMFCPLNGLIEQKLLYLTLPTTFISTIYTILSYGIKVILQVPLSFNKMLIEFLKQITDLSLFLTLQKVQLIQVM